MIKLYGVQVEVNAIPLRDIFSGFELCRIEDHAPQAPRVGVLRVPHPGGDPGSNLRGPQLAARERPRQAAETAPESVAGMPAQQPVAAE